MYRSARQYLCARCGLQVLICSYCDRGNVYCGDNCAKAARKEKQKQAQKRYEKKSKAKKRKAKRQQSYRQRKKTKATHQGSVMIPLYDLLLIELGKLKNKFLKCHFTTCEHQCCHFCGHQCSDFVRMFFLEQKKSSSFPAFG